MLTDSERKNISEFCIFTARIYVLAYIECSVACDVPVNDWMLFKLITEYVEMNKVVSQAALKKLRNHQWYLGSEMVPLSLFSSKSLIVEAMVSKGADWSVRGMKCSVV